MNLTKLVSAAIYRDGGSLDARFQSDKGDLICYWIQAVPRIDRDSREIVGFTKGPLRFSRNSKGAKSGQIVDSERESDIAKELRAFLKHPKFDNPISHEADPKKYLRYVEMMASAIEGRIKETSNK